MTFVEVDPQTYDNWYHTRRGQWIGNREFALLMKLLRPTVGARLLDVGCGTGYFTRHFARAGLNVTGADPDPSMLDYARKQSTAIGYAQAEAGSLPFEEHSFDYCSAVTSLCFVSDPTVALKEMWRVSKRGIVLGLLNRSSILYRQKHNRGGYTGARWDTGTDVLNWLARADIAPRTVVQRSAIFLPSATAVARLLEKVLPTRLPWGGFLAVHLDKPAVSVN